jgi:DNA-binding transcriptional LysR family regulator
MEIKTLKSFVAVATMKNFSAAARELNAVQSSISRHIADLEEELEVQLFWRNTREVKITPAGESLLRDAQEILASEISAKKQAKRAARGETGRLRVGHIGPACFSFLPELVRTYSKRYPDVQVQLRQMSVEQQVDAFAAELLDVGFLRPLPETKIKNFSMEEIYVDTLTAVIPDTHPLAREKSLRMCELKDDPFILFKDRAAISIFNQIIRACQREKFTPVIFSQPENMQTLLTEVASELGVSIVPGCVRKMYTQGCVFIPIDNQKPTIPMELYYRSSPYLPTVEAFVQIIRKAKPDIQRSMLL